MPGSCLFLILKRVISLFAGADLYNVFNVVNKDFSVTVVTGVQNAFCCFNNTAHGNLADYDIHLHLGKQVRFKRNAAVVLRPPSLHAASEHVGYGHTGYTEL